MIHGTRSDDTYFNVTTINITFVGAGCLGVPPQCIQITPMAPREGQAPPDFCATPHEEVQLGRDQGALPINEGGSGDGIRPERGAGTLAVVSAPGGLELDHRGAEPNGPGDRKALDQLMPVVYRELRAPGGEPAQGERPAHTLQPTALAPRSLPATRGWERAPWQNRAHFLGVAARAMREVLRRSCPPPQGAQARRWSRALTVLDESLQVAGSPPSRSDDLDQALADLARLSERQARVVELRYFGGLTIEETSEVMRHLPGNRQTRLDAGASLRLFRAVGIEPGRRPEPSVAAPTAG